MMTKNRAQRVAQHCVCGDIHVRPRMRALQLDVVEALSASMATEGLLHDITVRSRPEGGYWLVCGWHRLEAAKKLNWKTIRCRVFNDMDDDHAQLYEIDENLCVGELSPSERNFYIYTLNEIDKKQKRKQLKAK
jgi:ParB family chromosome partitioning protein